MHTPPLPNHQSTIAQQVWPAWSFLVSSFVPCQSSSRHHITSPRIAHRIASQLPSVDISASRPVHPIDFFSSPSHLDKTIDFFLFCRAHTIRFDTIVAVHFLACKCRWFPYLLHPSSSVLLSSFSLGPWRRDTTTREEDYGEGVREHDEPHLPGRPLLLSRHRPTRLPSSLQLDRYPMLLVPSDRHPRQDKTRHCIRRTLF